jgi:uncharacterized protein YjiS (DUF1127 family)
MRWRHASAVTSQHHLWHGSTYVPPVGRSRSLAIGAIPDGVSRTESIMTSRRFQEQTGLFESFRPDSQALEIERIRHEAIRARDEAIANGLRRMFLGLGRGLAALVAAVLSWPERRRTYENLRGLTDRELSDIGLTRGEIARVFEPEFRLNTRAAANSNKRSAPAHAA